jgi:hypothetical protein
MATDYNDSCSEYEEYEEDEEIEGEIEDSEADRREADDNIYERENTRPIGQQRERAERPKHNSAFQVSDTYRIGI